MTGRADVSRPSLLASMLAAGVGAGVRGRLFAPRSAAGPSRRSSTLSGTDLITAEPTPPANVTSYVSRPDLTPVGLTIQKAAGFAGDGRGPRFIFCAPKSPLAANAGEVTMPHDIFPPGATPGLMILDTAGELVWFKPLPGPHHIPFKLPGADLPGQAHADLVPRATARSSWRWSLRVGRRHL